MKYIWDWKASFADEKPGDVFDCLLAESLLIEGRAIPVLEATQQKYKVQTLSELGEVLQAKIKEYPKLETLFYEVEMPLIPVLFSMEQKGIELDCEQLKKVGVEIDKDIEKTAKTILDEVGYEINLSSPMQIGTFLAEKLGVPLSKTKTGQYATNEIELGKHKTQFPLIETILTYRELTKIKSTYIDSLIKKVDPQNRVHTTYTQVGVNTGRLSSSNPNLQNIPVATEQGRKIKNCFVSSKDKMLLSFDYSQQELRVLAHLSHEEKLIEAFQKELDIHKLTASQIFKVSYDEVTNEQRYVAKTINFGVVYGMSSYGMSEGLQIPVEDADNFIKAFYQTYPKIKEYYDEYLKNAKIHGSVETMLGRRRYVFAYPGQKFIDNATRRVLMNYPIQGSAAELTKMAMIEVHNKILTKRKDISLLLQIHDELVFEIDTLSEDQRKSLIEEIRICMEQVYPLVVPTVVGVKMGQSWGQLQSFSS